MINANRYRHTGRTYVNISRAFACDGVWVPRAHARGY